MDDPEADIRLAAFARLRELTLVYGGALPWAALTRGFAARGRTILFASAAEGIFRPAGMIGMLSLKTVVPKPKGRVWYHDQATPELETVGDVFWYAFTGSNPENTRNQWLRDAMLRRLPLIYFFGVAPGVYEPLFPAFIIEWNRDALSCGVSFSSEAIGDQQLTPAVPERRYALRTVQQRLHQAAFRERVLDAYGRRCALTDLPEPRLIDAAHIMSDGDELYGQPDVRNGICMSKLHHAAYDAGLIGIDTNMTIHVSKRLMLRHDGPMLELGLKALEGKPIRMPDDPLAMPDLSRLSARFQMFASQRG